MPPPDSTNGEVDTFVVRDHRRSPLSGLRSRTSRMFDMLGEIPIDSRCYDIYGFAIYGIASSRSRTKKGQRRTMILALLESRPRHGYEIAQLIELRSRGAIRFNVASLYPLLYRLEKRNWIRGRWVEKAGQRRRRYYRLTSSGKNVLSKQRAGWREFVEAINLITGIQHA